MSADPPPADNSLEHASQSSAGAAADAGSSADGSAPSSRVAILKGLENRYPLAVYGILITLVLAVVSFWLSWPSSRSLIYEVKSNTPVVSATDQVPDLRITYAGENIGTALRVVTMRILNDGSEFIREVDYATDAPLGIRVSAGALIDRPTLVDASNDYLRQNFSATLESKNRAVFPALIFNAGDYVLLKMLMVESPDGKLDFAPTGRIAGIGSITIREYVPPAGPWSWFWSLARVLLMVLDDRFVNVQEVWTEHPLGVMYAMNAPQDLSRQAVTLQHSVVRNFAGTYETII